MTHPTGHTDRYKDNRAFTAEVVAKVRFSDPSKLLAREPGWYWWFSATAPDGAALVGVMKGPFSTSDDAKTAAQDYGVRVEVITDGST